MTYKLITIFMLLIALLLGGALGYLILQSQTLWLVISIALLLALLAWWQTPCIRVALDEEQSSPKTAPLQCLKHWLLRLVLYIFLVAIVVLGRSIWWSQQPVLMNDSSEQKEQAFPISYAFKKIAWELGFASLPEFVEIPAGTFKMGSMIIRNEPPINEVTLPSFFMSQTTITFEQYDYYIWSILNKLANQQFTNYPYDENWGRENRPVINVSWHDAQGYVNWLSKQQGENCRLPSEAEWEYVAQKEVVKLISNASLDISTKPISRQITITNITLALSRYKVEDLVDNWTQDCYSEPYKGSEENNFLWEEASCNQHVVRGTLHGINNNRESYINNPERKIRFMLDADSFKRSSATTESRSNKIGFRVICSVF